MAEQTKVMAGETALFEQFRAMQGQPVRVTVLFPVTRERLTRLPGMLVAVSDGALVVDCTNLFVSIPDQAPVTIEFLVSGKLFWCHTILVKVDETQRLYLKLPDMLQEQQRRRYPRVDINVSVRLITHDGSINMPAILRDISAGGAYMETTQPIEPGNQVTLVFPLGTGMMFNNIEVEALRCTRLKTESFVVATRFCCSQQQQDELAAWVDRQLS